MITRNFKLCLNAGTALAPYINVNQYDHGEQWVFTLYNEDGTIYTPSTGAIIGIKADGRAIANAGSVVDGKVVINETEQMTAAAGRAIYELLIDGETHGTANFVVNVERRPADNADLSESDISLLQEAIDAAEVINEVIGEGGDPSELITENVNNWLDNHPEATTTVEDGAITAPKINSTLWDKLLVSEEASGNPASFDDGADDVPVSSLKVALEPIQLGSGDPSPSNVRPIIASNGKNLLNIHDISGWTIPSGGELSANGETVSMKILASGNTQYMLNQHLEGNKTVTVTFESSKNYGRLFVALRKMDDSGWMTNSDASIEGLTYNQYYNGWYTYFSGKNASQTITIPNCLYWQFGLGYGNNEVVTGETETISNPMIRLASITDSSYQPYQGIAVQQTGKNVVSAVTYGNPTNIYAPVIYGATYTLVAGKRYIFSFKTSNTGEQIYRQSPENLGLVSASAYSWFCDGTVKYFYGTAAQSITITNKSVISKATTGSAVGEVSEFMVEAVEDDVTTPSAYEPYTSASYPYTLGQSVYGGSVDLATGVLTVDKAYMLLDGSEAWALQSINSYGIANFGLNTRLSNYKEGSVSAIITDKFKRQTTTASQTTESGVYVASTSYLYVRMDSATVSTVADFKTWLAINNMQCVYDMGTPTTVQLTPQEVKTLLGYNNISSSGTVDVIYHADTKLYVDKMTNVDNNIIAPTEETFSATRNYTVNDLVIVNDTLYKVTANIAGGSAITPNSNVQQTTLGALIKALS